jgi:hypothetical protein
LRVEEGLKDRLITAKLFHRRVPTCADSPQHLHLLVGGEGDMFIFNEPINIISPMTITSELI